MYLRKKAARVALWALAMGLVVAAMGFKPAAIAEQGSGETVRFVLYGDTRDGHEAHRKLVALILEQKPDLVIQTGDLVHRGSQENLWKIYDDITGEMRRKVPVYSARGNHDAGGTGYEERVTAPFTSGNKLYYSFDKENCHFIALAVEGSTPYNANSPQYAWLKRDLAEAHGKAQHIFVFFHIAPSRLAHTARTNRYRESSAHCSSNMAFAPSSTATTISTITPFVTASRTSFRAGAALRSIPAMKAKARFPATSAKACITSSSATWTAANFASRRFVKTARRLSASA